MSKLYLYPRVTMVSVTSLLLVLGSCQKKGAGSGTSTDNSGLSISSASAASDDLTEAIAESGTSASYSPMSQDAFDYQPSAMSIERSCTTTASSGAEVKLDYSGAEQLTFSKGNGTPSINVTVDISRSGNETRTWTPATCDVSSKFATVDWTASGLALNVAINRTINRTRTISVVRRNGETFTKTKVDNVIATGNRSVTWAANESTPGFITRTKTINSEVIRTRSLTLDDGSTLETTSTVATVENSPLSVKVIRNATTHALVSKTVNSGTVKVTDKSGFYSLCTFKDVTFEFGSRTDKCLPTSGQIKCQNYAAGDANTPTSSIEINFGQTTTSTVSISTNGDTAEDYPDYNSKGCDLESAS